MKRILFAVVLMLATSGCAGTAHFPRVYLMPQVGVILTVVNNCSPFIDIESPSHGVLHERLPYSGTITLPMSSTPFSGAGREISVLVRGYTDQGVYLGSDHRTFHVNVRQGSRAEIWEVENIRADGNPGGCGVGTPVRRAGT